MNLFWCTNILRVQPSDRYQEPFPVEVCHFLLQETRGVLMHAQVPARDPRDVSIVANPWLGGDGNLKSEVEIDRINIGKSPTFVTQKHGKPWNTGHEKCTVELCQLWLETSQVVFCRLKPCIEMETRPKNRILRSKKTRRSKRIYKLIYKLGQF